MLVQDLITVLSANILFNYYPNKFPVNAPDDCVTVKLTGGSSPDYVAGIRTISFQVLVRANHPSDAETKANELFTFLNGKEFFNVGSVFVAYCRANQSAPVYIGVDENGRALYSLNFTCKTRG